MSNLFFDHPILNSPYERPSRHWELDASGQPTQKIAETRRRAEFITPIPKPKKQKAAQKQDSLLFDEGLSTQAQEYAHTAIINGVRQEVDKWRGLPNPADWRVTPETARLLQHWRHHHFSGIRPFFCQVEAVETAIWLTEVAPQLGKAGERFLLHLANANNDANPGILRLALKLATGAGKTTVMAMLIAWQTVNAVRRPTSKKFTRGFLVVTPGITIKDRLRVLQPNDPDSYYLSREMLPGDMIGDIERANRVAESHPCVRAYVKNHNLGLEVPYRYGSETRTYLPDFIVLIDDGHGEDDLLHLIVEIKGYRREDAKEKKSTMETYWVPGVNNLKQHGRWAFAEFTDVFQMQDDFARKVEAEFDKMIEGFVQ